MDESVAESKTREVSDRNILTNANKVNAGQTSCVRIQNLPQPRSFPPPRLKSWYQKPRRSTSRGPDQLRRMIFGTALSRSINPKSYSYVQLARPPLEVPERGGASQESV